MNPANTIETFWSRVEPDLNSGCWIWSGSFANNGYGRIDIAGRRVSAHRLAYEVTFGTIPAGMCVCHRCDTPACVNPDHLFLGSNADNVADKVAKGRTARGEGAGRAKLTEDQVKEIRSLRGTLSQSQIAKHFGIIQPHVSSIMTGRAWAESL